MMAEDGTALLGISAMLTENSFATAVDFEHALHFIVKNSKVSFSIFRNMAFYCPYGS